MGAAQPFISGAISKTVNMPHAATAAEIRSAYVDAWKMGLKCVAIYRDGSKRSQPLNTKKTNENKDSAVVEATNAAESAVDQRIEEKENRINELETLVSGLQKQATQPLRRRLEDTRMAVNHKFDI